MSLVLGIETSCDETGIALVEDGRRVRAEAVASQVDVHRAFGGVVPEIASRQHTTSIVQLTRQVLDEAGCAVPDAVAATNGPGLMGSLLVGTSFAKSLALAWARPYLPIHHIEGHLFSVFLEEDAPDWPFLALIVSGGHTQLTACDAPHRYRLLGATRDDAVGECFDKVARLLGLPYPGGPSIQAAAEGGDPTAFDLPRAMRDSDDLAFSYSGLKTAVRYALNDGGVPVPDMAASFQAAAIDILVHKTRQALAQTGLPRLVVAGGVAANALLRMRLQAEAGVPVFVPALRYCLDNGAMIAAAGYSRWQHDGAAPLTCTPAPSLPL